MPDQPEQHRPSPILPDWDPQAMALALSMQADLRHVANPTARRGLANIRAVAIAMANVQADPRRFELSGEGLLTHLDDPNTGHLVAAMALYMSRYPSNPTGAVHILEHAAQYILYISRHVE